VATWCERCALQFPALALLASEFLHADWPDEYEDVDDAVHAFATGRPALAARLAAEVDNLLAEMLSDEQLEDMLVGHLGLAYRPDRGVTYERWLREVAQRVRGLMARS
jgi:contact-dependent growth inhibition (CDI) system CdiI-like immunity protein